MALRIDSKPKTLKARQGSSGRARPNVILGSHLSTSVCAKLRGWAEAQWLNLSSASAGSGSKTSNTCEKHIAICNDGAGDWLVHNFELNKDWFCALPDSASSERHASISERVSDDFDCGAFMDRHDQHGQMFQTNSSHSPQSWSRRPNRYWQNRWWETSQNRGIRKISTLGVGEVPESFYRSPFSVVAALVPLAQQMAKRSRPFTDEASKYTGAPSKSKPVGKRVLTLAAVRHEKSSLLISAQEKRSPMSKARRIQFRHRATDCISQVLPGILEVTELDASDLENHYWMP